MQKQTGALKLPTFLRKGVPHSTSATSASFSLGDSVGLPPTPTAGGSGRAMEQFASWVEETVCLMFAQAQEITPKHVFWTPQPTTKLMLN